MANKDIIIGLKYPKSVFPNKFTKLCEHDFAKVVENAKRISIKEAQKFHNIRDKIRKERTGHFEMMAIRQKKGVRLVKLDDDY